MFRSMVVHKRNYRIFSYAEIFLFSLLNRGTLYSIAVRCKKKGGGSFVLYVKISKCLIFILLSWLEKQAVVILCAGV